MPDQGFRVGVESLREMQLSLENVLVDDKGIIICERIDPCNHLIDEDSKSPPIHGFSMSLVLQYLGSKVFWRPTERESPSFDNLSKAEVRQFQIPINTN